MVTAKRAKICSLQVTRQALGFVFICTPAEETRCVEMGFGEGLGA
jgi:hypothetical protein